MTITPAQLTAERLTQIADAKKYLKWALMDTIERYAIANNHPEGLKPIAQTACGMLTRIVGDLELLDDLAADYAAKEGVFKDYIL